MLQIFRFFWTIWCIIACIFTLIVFFPFLLIGIWTTPKNQPNKLYWLPYRCSQVLLFLFGVKINIIGEELLKKDQQYIYIFNHSSNLDPFIAAIGTRGKGKFLGKAEILKYPVFGMVLKNIGVAVQRDDATDRLKSIKSLQKALNQGDSIIIFPEGTRNKTPNLLNPFHKGAFLLSKTCNVPIAILTTPHSKKLQSANNWWLRPGKLNSYWSKPLFPENFNNFDEMKNFAYQEMLKNMQKD